MYSLYLLKQLYRVYVLLSGFLITLLCCDRTAGQVPGMRKYTQLDGYTATVGYEIEQDEKGYIWLGTDNGGMSFDGKTFRVAQDVSKSTDAEVLFCRPLGAGRILLLPLSNTPSYMDKGKLVTAEQDTFLRDIKLSFNHCKQDPVTGKWWLSHWNSKILYGFIGKKAQRYEIHRSRKYPFDFYRIINNKLIGQEAVIARQQYNLCLYDMNRERFRYLRDSSGRKKEIGKEVVTGLGSDPEHIVTIGEKCVRIYHYDTATNILRELQKIAINAGHNLMYSRPLLLDRNNSMWIKAEQGLIYYRNVDEKNSSSYPYYLPEPVLINSVFVDRNKNIWISAPDNALYFLSEKHFKNELLTGSWPHKKLTPQAIAGNEGGDICISYANRSVLSCIRGKSRTDIDLGRYFAEGSRHILPLGRNRFILYSQKISLLDLSGRTIESIDTPGLIKNISICNDSSLLIAEIHGVHFISSIGTRKQKTEKIFNQRATAAVMLADQHILIGTPDGLYTKEVMDAAAVKINHPVLSKSNITDIQVRARGGAFVGTNAQGLFMVQGANNHVQKIELEGSNNIRRLYLQNDSTFWVATDNGAYCLGFDKNWSVVRMNNYTFYDGLPSNNITDIYVHSDTAYFTTSKGLGIIPLKDSSRTNMAPPGIYINSVRTDTTVFHEPDSTISLPHYQNNMLISLSAISYESLGNITYYYQLYPLHDKWIQTTNPEVRFTGLPPGDYTFRVYAVNAKGIKSKQPALLRIKIKPAFWQTGYFIVSLVIITCILLYVVLRWSIRRGERKKFELIQQKKRLAELELEAIKAQINPHFIYNCLNSIKYLNYTGAYKQTQEYLSIFAKLIRLTMQYSRRTFITLAEETDYLSHYLQLEQLRFKHKLQHIIYIDPALNTNMLLPAMLLQPYVENALKHGIGGRKEHGRIEVLFQKKSNDLEILIKDNGPGFSSLAKPDSLGLHLSGTRAVSYNELFNLDIKVSYYNEQDNGPGKTGAVVKITFKTITSGPIIQ